MIRKSVLFLVLFTTTQLLVAQRTLHVPATYKTIQDAINAGQSSDTVLVAPGRYVENLDVEVDGLKILSSAGPARTIIDGAGRGTTVTFSYVGRNTELAGFTVTGGSGYWITSPKPNEWPHSGKAGGIGCCWASPTIRDNYIIGNSMKMDRYHVSAGGGIYVTEGAALIQNNVIAWNAASAGGGIYASRTQSHPLTSLEIVTNWIDNNNSDIGGGVYVEGYKFAWFNSNRITGNWGNSGAGGIHVSSGCVWSLNDTFFGNRSYYSGGALTVLTNAEARIRNGVLWDNRIHAYSWEALIENQATLYLDYSTVDGGYFGLNRYPSALVYWGTGMSESDPGFVDPAGFDLHLRADSPCVDAGDRTVSGLLATDHEGDPRVSGASVDMGADEFFPHLYHTGSATPGGAVTVKLIGFPSSSAFWAFSAWPLSQPVSVPGLAGLLYLYPPLTVLPAGVFPANGVISIPYGFAPGFPLVVIPTQALMGTRLSNLDLVDVR